METRKKNTSARKPKNNDTKERAISSRTRTFQARESLLTELFKDKNIKSLYNVFPGIAFFTILHSVLQDYQREGRPYFGTRLLRTAFSQFHLAVVVWVCMFLSCLAVYIVFIFWAQMRKLIQWKGLWDRLFGITYVLYVLCLSHIIAIIALKYHFGAASCLAMMTEMTRLLMKSYAFIRSNISNQPGRISPSFSQYLYFLFAPTLIYNDSYPRTKTIRWGLVAISVMEIIIIVFMYSVLIENSYLHFFKNLEMKNYTAYDIFTAIVQCNSIGLFLFILFFYSCHCYFNATAELMRFSDRLFYKDWWTAENLDVFLRKWSYFVHEWLHIYIYRDCYEILFPGRKLPAKLVVLLLSGYFHDLIFCVASGSFLPWTTISFLIFGFIGEWVGNRLVLGLLGIQMSCIAILYILECYARVHCTAPSTNIIDYIKPRFIYC